MFTGEITKDLNIILKFMSPIKTQRYAIVTKCDYRSSHEEVDSYLEDTGEFLEKEMKGSVFTTFSGITVLELMNEPTTVINYKISDDYNEIKFRLNNKIYDEASHTMILEFVSCGDYPISFYDTEQKRKLYNQLYQKKQEALQNKINKPEPTSLFKRIRNKLSI